MPVSRVGVPAGAMGISVAMRPQRCWPSLKHAVVGWRGRRREDVDAIPFPSGLASMAVMLASLLPGLRDFRTPLVTGYLCFACIWLWFGSSLIPDGDGPTPAERQLADLFDYVGPTAALTVLSTAAYLVGSMLTIRTFPLKRIQGLLGGAVEEMYVTLVGWARSVTDEVHPGISYTDLSNARLPQQMLVKMTADIGRDHQQLPFRLAEHVQEYETKSLEMKLKQKRENLWVDYDRLQTEASLRFSIFVPLVVLVITLAFQWHGAALFTLVVPLVLLGQGITTLAESRLMLYTAIANRTITSSTADLLRGLAPVERSRPLPGTPYDGVEGK